MTMIAPDRIKNLRAVLYQKQAQQNALQESLDSTKAKLEEASREQDLTERARKLLELFVKSTEGRIRNYIEPLITEGLDFVFDQGMKFHLVFANRRNQIEVDFIVLRDTEMEELYQRIIKDPVKNAKQLEQLVKETKNINFMYGGAINQVISLILRLVLVELFKIQGPVLLDEPSSAVGEEYSPRLGQLLTSLSTRFKRQIILVTHSRSLASFAEKTYQVSKVNGVATIKEREGA